MSRTPRTRSAWLIGIVVLVALLVAGTAMLWRLRQVVQPTTTAAVPTPGAEVVEPMPVLTLNATTRRATALGVLVRGLVVGPAGEPVAGAKVTPHRLVTAWPEWRSEPIDLAAITDARGSFQFRVELPQGVFVRCEHPAFATLAVPLDEDGNVTVLRLGNAFSLTGFVTNDAGAPVPNARVALESVPGEQRRVEVAITEPNGRYAFANLAAGPVRVVARHPSWQPSVEPTVVVGDQARVDLVFDRPAMAPLRGRVVAAATQAPIAGATIELLPPNQVPGLVDPASGTSAADGTFLLTGLGRGLMRMLVRHPEHGAVVRSQLVGSAAGELLLEMPARTVVRGRIDADGASLHRPGDLIELRDLVGKVHYVELDAAGRFACSETLSPGELQVQALGARFAFENGWSSTTTVLLEETEENVLELPVVPPTVVRGRIVDAGQRPIAGVALVRTRPLLDDATQSIRDAARDLDFREFGSRIVQLFDDDRDEVLVRTDADGRFEIRGQPPGKVLVRAELAGFGRQMARFTIDRDEALVYEDLVLRPGVGMRGRVLRGTGSVGIAGATVVVAGEQTQAQVVSDRDGNWAIDDLIPGNYRVRARMPTGLVERVVQLRAGTAGTIVDLRVDTGRTVRGMVRGSDGQPLPGALVAPRGGGGRTTVTDGSGEFVLEVPQRAEALQVALFDRSLQRIVPLVPGKELVEVKLDTPPTCTLLARVAGLPGRKPLAGGVLRIVRLDGDDELERSSRWLEFPDGQLRWPLCPTGHLRVEVWCEGHAPIRRDGEFAAGKEHDLGELLLEPGAHLRGVVRDVDGALVPNAVVLLGEEGDLQLFESGQRTDADGSFRLRGVTNRSDTLVVRAPGYAPAVATLTLPDDLLSPEPFELRLSRGATIRVNVPRNLREGGYVQLLRDGRLLAASEVDESGRVEFVHRAVGAYLVRLVGSGTLTRAVEVAPDAQLVSVDLQ